MNYLTPEQRAFGWGAGDSAGKSWFREDADRNECRARIAGLIREAENDLIERLKANTEKAEWCPTCGYCGMWPSGSQQLDERAKFLEAQKSPPVNRPPESGLKGIQSDIGTSYIWFAIT